MKFSQLPHSIFLPPKGPRKPSLSKTGVRKPIPSLGHIYIPDMRKRPAQMIDYPNEYPIKILLLAGGLFLFKTKKIIFERNRILLNQSFLTSLSTVVNGTEKELNSNPHGFSLPRRAFEQRKF
jgi:hypothetical protein